MIEAAELEIGPAPSAGRPSRDRLDEARRLTVCYPLAGDSLGGSHVSLRGLLDQLDRRRYRLLVVPERPTGNLARYFAAYESVVDPGAPSRSLEPGRAIGPLQLAGTLTGLRKRISFLRENQVDIVHTNDGRTHAAWALAAKIAGARLLWHHRGDPNARGLRYLAPLLADRIVTVSRFALPRSSRGAARSASVVYSPFDETLAVDRTRSRSALLETLGCPSDTVFCGYFGSFIDRKRPMEFIEAVLALRGKLNRPVVGLLFGQGGYPELEARLARRIEDADVCDFVRMMGYRSPGHEWIAGCDVLLVPAVDEPLGRTLVEAMIVGTPVIATNSGGNPEALRDGCGILVPPDDPEAMAEAAAQLLADSDGVRAMTERASRIAADRFSRARHCETIEAIYAELAAN